MAVLVLIVILLCAGPAHAYDAKTDASGIADSIRSQTGSKDGFKQTIVNPTITNTKMKTIDGKQKFDATLMCSDPAPIVQVNAFPVGSIQDIGELNIKIQYDIDSDGEFDDTTIVHNVAGMCGNGIIKDCSPSGSWKSCRYCTWHYEDGKIKEKCDFINEDTGQAVPLGPQNLQGCFCFNAACGSPVLGMLEQILSFTAKGFTDIIRKVSQEMAITDVNYNSSEMSLAYMGANVEKCSSVGSNSTVAKLKGLRNSVTFPIDETVADAEADNLNPYSSLKDSFEGDVRSNYQCTMRSLVTPAREELERTIRGKIGVGLDANGGSKQCYLFSSWMGCHDVLTYTSSWNTCLNTAIPNHLSRACNILFKQNNYFKEITGVSNYEAVSNRGNLSGCYGADNDYYDQYFEMDCTGKRIEDRFICQSPSMSIAGETIYNDSQQLFQGCNRIIQAQNQCEPLEIRRANGECELVSELTDGVYTIREGTRTNVTQPEDCRSFEGTDRSIIVCEPWWEKKRIYRCSDKASFSNLKERVSHVKGNINYDTDSGKWENQPDLTFDKWEGGQGISKVYDLTLQFDATAKKCTPACTIQKTVPNTDVYIPGQGKIESDAGYHDGGTGEQTQVRDGTKRIEEIRECKASSPDTEADICPVDSNAGETLVSACSCYDDTQMSKAISYLQVLNFAGTDVICSSGQKQGFCAEPEETSSQVVCGNFIKNADGSITTGEVTPCSPRLWQGNILTSQIHTLFIDSDFKCQAYADTDLTKTILIDEYDEDTAKKKENDKSKALLTCLDTYLNPAVKFSDEANRAFSHSPSDVLFFKTAYTRSELPAMQSQGELVLPEYPPVYRPTSAVRNMPMFEAEKQTMWYPSNINTPYGSVQINLTNIRPYVYYWECPQGQKTAGTANTCNAVDPFGGIDKTIRGSYCFEKRCDAQAISEASANKSNSGCGYQNDGEWQ